MKDIIGIAILAGGLWGGTIFGEKLLALVRTAALTKAANGLPGLSPFAATLTGSKAHALHSGHGQPVSN